jgi:hypothetical protein
MISYYDVSGKGHAALCCAALCSSRGFIAGRWYGVWYRHKPSLPPSSPCPVLAFRFTFDAPRSSCAPASMQAATFCAPTRLPSGMKSKTGLTLRSRRWGCRCGVRGWCSILHVGMGPDVEPLLMW